MGDQGFHIQACWDFGQDERPPHPVIYVQISPIAKQSFKRIICKVDTGFNGVLSLSDEVVKDLGLKPYGTILATTATNMVEVPIYRVLLTQEELKIRMRHITALGTRRSLAGRMLLANNQWLLDFVSNKLCLLTP